ncbi:Os01g0109366, partial [Oryza sativa Japonica Group]
AVRGEALRPAPRWRPPPEGTILINYRCCCLPVSQFFWSAGCACSLLMSDTRGVSNLKWQKLWLSLCVAHGDGGGSPENCFGFRLPSYHPKDSVWSTRPINGWRSCL